MVMNVTPILCHVHFLKNAIRKIKKLNLEKEATNIFIYGFIGLQNSTNIKDFNRLLVSLHTVFNQKHCGEERLYDCIRTIQREASNNNSRVNDSDYFDDQFERNNKFKEHLEFLYITEDFYGNYDIFLLL